MSDYITWGEWPTQPKRAHVQLHSAGTMPDGTHYIKWHLDATLESTLSQWMKLSRAIRVAGFKGRIEIDGELFAPGSDVTIIYWFAEGETAEAVRAALPQIEAPKTDV